MTLVTYTGKVFDYDNITKESIDITDVIHSLSRINRFIGHSKRPYSVGEHTLLGLRIAETLGFTPLQKLHWFKHDFTEAYVGDCPTPLKNLLPKFKELETEVEKAIESYLGLKPMTEEEELLVKRIDNTMLVLEMKYLTLHNYENFITSQTYLRFVYDENFEIDGHPWDDRELTRLLYSEFKKLIEEVKSSL